MEYGNLGGKINILKDFRRGIFGPGVALLVENSLDTVQLQRLVSRMQEGESAASNELIRRVCGRLERKARKMLRDDPRVHRWEETGDVLQGACLRLVRALREVMPKSSKEFFALANLQIRRELIDLARHYYGSEGEGANHASVSNDFQPSDQSGDPARLAEWTEFHEWIGKLPDKERAVFELRYYQGFKNREIAEVLEIDVSTVERRWHSALIALSRKLPEGLPDLD